MMEKEKWKARESFIYIPEFFHYFFGTILKNEEIGAILLKNC